MREIKFRAWDKRYNLTHALSYIAGIFDGEGCVRIKKANHSNNCYFIIVHIVNSNLKVLKFIKNIFGFGKINFQEKGKNLTIYQYHTSSAEAISFLKTIKEFTIIKTKQIELAIEFHSKYNELSTEQKVKFYEKMRNLKKEDIYENPEMLEGLK